MSLSYITTSKKACTWNLCARSGNANMKHIPPTLAPKPINFRNWALQMHWSSSERVLIGMPKRQPKSTLGQTLNTVIRWLTFPYFQRLVNAEWEQIDRMFFRVVLSGIKQCLHVTMKSLISVSRN